MTEKYTITGHAPDIFVLLDETTPVGGPYKNDESAKRRIRDLKRKETTNDTLVEAKIEQIKAVNVTPATHEFVETPDKCEPLPDLREIATGKIISALTVPTPNVEKLAASSAYGKTHHPNGNISMPIKKAPTPAIASMDNYVPLRRAPIARPVGCYPAVPKRAYQR